MGLPRIWGRVGSVAIEGGVVREKEDEDIKEEERLGVAWTVAYYVILLLGMFAWWWSLWPLTKSERALIKQWA